MPRTAILFFLAAIFLFSSRAFAQNSLETRYSSIHYSQESELTDFLWRLTGQRYQGPNVSDLTVNRVDEIVERVQTLLDMRPPAFHFDIYLKPTYSGSGTIAYYSHETRSITAIANRVTDGVLAHEIAHAVINASFTPPPAEKSQEILAQYVDQHLWSEAM